MTSSSKLLNMGKIRFWHCNYIFQDFNWIETFLYEAHVTQMIMKGIVITLLRSN